MCQRHLPRHVTRRDVLRFTMAGMGLTALGSLGLRKLPLAEGAPLTNHKRVVVIFCYGGYDGLNMLVPITSTAYYLRRPTIGIPAVSALALNGTSDYGLHPTMNRLQGLFNTDQSLAIVRKAGYPNENLSHFTSQDIYSEGVRGEFAPLGIPESGWIARLADQLGLSATGAVAVGVGRPLDVEGGTVDPLLVSSLNTFEFAADQYYPSNHLHRIETLKGILDSFSGGALESEAAAALSLSHDLVNQVQDAVISYSSPYMDAYPLTSPGRYLKDAAILFRYGFDTQIVFTGFSGWDTHANQGAGTGVQASLIDRMDEAIGVFSDDLKFMGIWNDTLIVVVSEFGRRMFQNGGGGTDHGHGNIFYVTGGGVLGGLYGPEITDSEIGSQNYLDYGVDFRDIYKEIISAHLGGDPLAVFPEPQEINTTLGFLP